MDLWLASPVIFLVGFSLLYSNSVIVRLAGVSVIASALGIASSPGDADNWYMAAALAAIGAISILIFRPRWFTAPKHVRWQFSLRALLIATAVFGVCLAFNLWVLQHMSEQLSLARSVRPILQNYKSTIGTRSGQVVWLSVNAIPPHETLGGIGESDRIGCSRWFEGSGAQKPFGDPDLAGISHQHQELRYLDLRQSSVTENGLRHLQNLNALERLWLDPSQCTTAGLAHLQDLASLKELSIDSRNIDGDLGSLREALPDCEISP